MSEQVRILAGVDRVNITNLSTTEESEITKSTCTIEAKVPLPSNNGRFKAGFPIASLYNSGNNSELASSLVMTADENRADWYIVDSGEFDSTPGAQIYAKVEAEWSSDDDDDGQSSDETIPDP